MGKHADINDLLSEDFLHRCCQGRIDPASPPSWRSAQADCLVDNGWTHSQYRPYIAGSMATYCLQIYPHRQSFLC